METSKQPGEQDVAQPKDQNLIFDYSDRPAPRRRPASRNTGGEVAGEDGNSGEGNRSNIIFFVTLGVIIMFLASFFAIGYYKSHKRALTIEELHDLNFKGKLKEDQGYVYKGIYSFVKQDGFWYTALQSQSGRTAYNFAFRYSPHELESFPVSGALNTWLFNNASEYYITFNPTAKNLSYTVLAVNDYNQHMLNVFGKTPIAACDRNETAACEARPIITCNAVDGVVVYIKDSDAPGLEFSENCIIISGRGFDQVKGVDRALYTLYTIMS